MNDNLNNDKIFNLYTLSELYYQKHFQNQVNNIELLYPRGWYENKNYKKKIEIISEAIKTNTLIINTQGYKELLECVKKYVKE